MKNYDPNIRWGTHTIKVSFQRWDYKGFVTFRRGGICKGLTWCAGDLLLARLKPYVRVTGNIYENSELLEEQR